MRDGVRIECVAATYILISERKTAADHLEVCKRVTKRSQASVSVNVKIPAGTQVGEHAIHGCKRCYNTRAEGGGGHVRMVNFSVMSCDCRHPTNTYVYVTACTQAVLVHHQQHEE